jgi:hypothetical protein
VNRNPEKGRCEILARVLRSHVALSCAQLFIAHDGQGKGQV